MGRKPVGKVAMTDAQRQRKRRQRLGREKREAEMMEKRARNEARAHASPPTWAKVDWKARRPMETPADEIACQIEEMLADMPGTTIDDVREAIDRWFGE